MTRRVRPRKNLVLVRRWEREKESAGGVLLPENAKQKIDGGVVVDVGPAVDRSEVRPGMTVRFRHYAGIAVTHEGEKHLLLEDRECIAEELEEEAA